MATREQLKEISAEIDQMVIGLLKQGYTYNRIADVISKTGNNYLQTRKAIAGRVLRLSDAGVIPKRRSVKKGDTIKGATSYTIAVKSRERYKLEDWKLHGNPEDAITIMELTNNSCKFPFESGKYCGHDSVVGSYCVKHSLVCHRPNTKRVA